MWDSYVLYSCMNTLMHAVHTSLNICSSLQCFKCGNTIQICNERMFYEYWPTVWSLLFPTLFSASLDKAGPKHSTSVPFSSGVAVAVSVDAKEVALVPNSAPAVTVKELPEPHGPGALAVLCNREHSLLPPTLQMVTPFLSPTVHLKVNISPGQVGGGVVSFPVTSPGSM